MDAALEEYGEHGWSGFTMDGVARRAGVGKSTVYLRWQDKQTLLTDAVSASGDELGAVDTGDLRGDLHALAVNLFHHYRDPAGWAGLRIVVDTAGAPQRLHGMAESVGDVHVEFVDAILRRAHARGELPAGISADNVAEVVYGSVMMQTLGVRLDGRELTDEEIEERAVGLVGIVLDGVLA